MLVPIGRWCGTDTAIVSKVGQLYFTLYRLHLPTRFGQRWRVGQQHQQRHVPSSTKRVHDQAGGSGQLGLRAGYANNLLVKKIRRNRYSTTDHIHDVTQLKERCREYNIPLCIAFVDYEKAFASVQTQAVLTSPQEQGIECAYIELLKEIYTNSSMTVHLHKESNKVNIRRGLRQEIPYRQSCLRQYSKAYSDG